MGTGSPTQLHTELATQLDSLPTSSPDQDFIRRYLGTPRPVLGVRSADLRMLAKNTAKAHADWHETQWLALLDLLYAGKIFEQRSLAGMLLSLLHPLRHKLELARLRTWLVGLTGWAEVDITCQSSWTAKEVLARWDEWDAFLDSLNRSDNISLRRASLVLMVTPLRRSTDPRLTQRALTNVERLEHERERLISKAVSWVLRTMGVEQPDIVRTYLDDHANALQSTVVREVTKKLDTGRKSG